MHPDDAQAGGNTLKLGWQILGHFGHIEAKLPTPTVADQYTDNLKSTQHVEGSMHSVTLAQFVNRPDLLPTPTAVEYKGAAQSEVDAGDPKHRLKVLVMTNQLEQWGKFAAAIERWQTVIGRPAPAPTNPDGKDDKHRLNPVFVEWLMGLPEGHVTGVDINRNDMLKALGNGVVPQQAALALTMLYKGIENV